MSTNYKSDVEAVQDLVAKYNQLRSEIGKVIIGQDEVVRDVLISIFSRGHCLLVGVPGLAKTLLVNTIAQTLGLTYNRIQFTPDLMPSDIIGTEILDESRHFRFIKGPLFANIILADEINRTPPKTQSALLESMEERNVTYDGKTHKLPNPHMVIATQNPIEIGGTYPLPESQLDRFMMSLSMGYPSAQDEAAILQGSSTKQKLSPIISQDELFMIQNVAKSIYVADIVVEYIIGLSHQTR